MQQKSSRDSTQSETMTKAVGAALVLEILAQSPPAVKVWRVFLLLREPTVDGAGQRSSLQVAALLAVCPLHRWVLCQ